MHPVSCHDTCMGHTCGGINGECVRRGYHECAGGYGPCGQRWPYQPPHEAWAYPEIGTEDDPEWVAWRQWWRKVAACIPWVWLALLTGLLLWCLTRL